MHYLRLNLSYESQEGWKNWNLISLDWSNPRNALVKGESITRLYEMDQELHLNLF